MPLTVRPPSFQPAIYAVHAKYKKERKKNVDLLFYGGKVLSRSLSWWNPHKTRPKQIVNKERKKSSKKARKEESKKGNTRENTQIFADCTLASYEYARGVEQR